MTKHGAKDITNDPAKNPTGPRTYEGEDVRPRSQGRMSPGETEPSDIGAFEGRGDEAAPAENAGSKSDRGYRGG